MKRKENGSGERNKTTYHGEHAMLKENLNMKKHKILKIQILETAVSILGQRQ